MRFGFIKGYIIDLLRVYPVEFAEEIKQILPKNIGMGIGKPADSESDKATGPETFESLSWATWPEAHLIPCLRYLRGGQGLEVPSEWMRVFPQPFEILHKQELRSTGAAHQ